jgi:uncharacterized protein (DUF58 family)
MYGLFDRIFEWIQSDDEKRPFVPAPWDSLPSESVKELPWRYRFNPRLKGYLVFLVVLFLGAGVFLTNRFLASFGLGVLALLAYSFYLARRSITNLKIEKVESPKQVFEHESFSIKIQIRNRGDFTVSSMMMRLAFDGSQKYEAYAMPIFIPPHESRPLQFDFQADRGMGEFSVGMMHLITQDPLGLFSLCIEIKSALTVNVLPQEIPLESFKVYSAALAIHAGAFEVKSPGDAPSFLGLREWRPGDKTKRIDWKRSEQLGHLIIREFERLNAADATIFFDQNSASHCEYKNLSSLETLKDSAVSLVNCLIQQQLSLQFISESIQIPFARGSDHARICLEEIQKLKTQNQAPFDQTLDRYLIDAPVDSVAILLFTSVQSDFLGLMKNLIRLQERRIDTILILADIPQFLSAIESEIHLDSMNQNILESLKDYMLDVSQGGKMADTLAHRTFILGPSKTLADIYYA